MKRHFLLPLLLLAVPVLRMNAGVKEEISAAFQSGDVVSISFSCRIGKSSVGNGTALLSSGAYRLSTPVLELWCDGENRWVVDRVAEEVTLEAVEGDAFEALSMFDVESEGDVMFESQKTRAVRLQARDEFNGIRFLTLYKSGHSYKGALLDMADGTSFTFVFTSVKSIPSSSSSFSFDTTNLPSSYIVTDLR